MARSTIDGWEKNPRPPRSRSVNAVADELGIPRERALRLAGIIETAPGGNPVTTGITQAELRAMNEVLASRLAGEPEEHREDYASAQAKVQELIRWRPEEH